MITLRKARGKAKELTNGDYTIPGMSTLGDWRGYGCLTDPLKYANRGRQGGRVGLYHNSLPIQIATAAELKDTKAWGLKEIGKIAKQIIPLIIENEDPQVDRVFFSTFLEIDEDMDQAKEASDPEELEKAEEKLEKALEKIQRRYLVQDYHSLWNKYEARYEKEKIKQ